MSTVLLLGEGGQLGRLVNSLAPDSVHLLAPSHQALDITDPESLQKYIAESDPDVIINCAAYTAVDLAEKEPDLAFAVNAQAVENLALAAGENTRIIHVSTDFVFSNKADKPYKPLDPVHPVSVYGKSKYAGEQALLKERPAKSVIVRTSWLYSEQGGNFVTTMLSLMRERPELNIVNDQFGSPTSAIGLASVLWMFVGRNDTSGIYHWSDRGVISWYDFAREIQAQGLESGLLKEEIRLKPISTAEYPTPAQRPVYSALDCTSTEETLGVSTRSWQSRLRDVMKAIAENT